MTLLNIDSRLNLCDLLLQTLMITRLWKAWVYLGSTDENWLQVQLCS